MAYPSPPMTEEEWFPSGGPHPTTVSPTLMVARPPAQIPEGLLDRSRPKASGVVRLPEHIAWSPPYEYDLDDRRHRLDAYQRVMTEGLAADVLWFIDVAEVVAMWGDMVLSPHIRVPWERWLRAHGLLDWLVLTPLQAIWRGRSLRRPARRCGQVRERVVDV